MAEFSVLPGLPPYGELPRAFPPEWGRFGREGVVVRFETPEGRTWTGNFAPGFGGVSGAYAHPDGRRVVVFAKGDVWVVTPGAETAERLAGEVDAVWPVRQPDGFVLSLHGLAFARLSVDGILWHTRRISWDGFDDLLVDATRLTGLAWNPITDRWDPLEVNLATGASVGGSFDSHDSEGWEQLAS